MINKTYPSDVFDLHPILASDTIEVSQLDCCKVLLMNDFNYPWLILVPQRPGLRELHDLKSEDLFLTTSELFKCSEAMESLFSPDKINIGLLGNQVPQLHIHVIARFIGDPAWPKPVWGQVPVLSYMPKEIDKRIDLVRSALSS
jgi:diadenosine tetraphosphate (Ap4A) HIT family hydrolase